MMDCLGNVALVTMGQSPDSEYYSDEEVGLPFLQGCAEFQAKTPKPVLFCSHAKKIATAGSILLSVRAPVGRTNMADRDYIIGRGLAGILATEIDQNYLAHYLAYSESRLRNISQGSTFEAINGAELKRWLIAFPKSRFEQTKIAEILCTVDRAIEQTEALIAKQQRVKTGLMQDLLTRGIDEHGNLRSEETHQFKDSPLGRIPVEWGVNTLGCLSSNITKGESPNWQGYEYQSEGVLFVTSENVRDGYLDLVTARKFIPEAFHKKLERSQLQKGDVLINLVGASIARTAVFNIEEAANINQAVCLIQSGNLINPIWLAEYLRLPNNVSRLLGEQVETARANLSLGDIRSFDLAVPPIDEQRRVSELIIGCDRQSQKNEEPLIRLCSLKTALMQDLLTGKVRVTPLLDSAEVTSE
jgi:type I restriction enzyme S subunit